MHELIRPSLALGLRCVLYLGVTVLWSAACSSAPLSSARSEPGAVAAASDGGSPKVPSPSRVAEHRDAGAEVAEASQPAAAAEPCPEGMQHVQHSFCPDMRRRCVKSEYDRSNHITICHRFAEGENECRGERTKLDFCIDRYEYPNQRGGHPPVMVSWFDAGKACEARGKRLCYESEWVTACEGPDEKPFPYGWTRSSQSCNIDNRWISPSLTKIYSRDPSVRDPELARLDQSKPSGAMAGCVSDFGVYDLTGNFDEWTRADRERPTKRAKSAALKGGAWGHVRNACRPVTTSHEPEFTYYFVSFRCCSDPHGAAPFTGVAAP